MTTITKVKAVLERSRLAEAWQQVAPLAKGGVRPILGNVRLRCDGQSATLTATDGDTTIQARIDCAADPCIALLPADRVGPVLRECTDSEIELGIEPGRVRIKTSRSKFEFPTMDEADWPDMPPLDLSGYHTADADRFADALRRTAFACDESSSRYALGGVLVEWRENHLDMVATDGRRLSHAWCPAVGHQHNPDSTIIPVRVIRVMLSILADADECRLSANANRIQVEAGSVVLTSRLLEGRFPRWADVIPADAETTEFPIGALATAVSQAAICTSKESRSIDCRLADGLLTLSAANADLGQSSIDVPAAWEAEPVTVTLDHRYVTDLLRVLPSGESIRFTPHGNDGPTLWRFDGVECVIMPLAK